MFPDLLELVSRYPDKSISMACQSLYSDRAYAIQANRVYHAASTMKIGVMMEAYRQAEIDHRFSRKDSWFLTNQFRSIYDRSFYSLSPEDDSDPELYDLIGQKVEIQNLIDRMIRKSSNLATNELMAMLGEDRPQMYMKQLGAPEVVIRRGVEDKEAYIRGMNNTTTAQGLANILLPLARKEVVNAEASQSMIDVMLGQEHNEGIPEGLPRSWRVAHKTGWNGAFYHDAGIIFAPHWPYPIVLVFLTEGFTDWEEAGFFVSLATHRLFRAED